MRTHERWMVALSAPAHTVPHGPAHRHRRANRIDLQLRHHLGTSVDTHRTLHDARYARDVLLVCEALKDTDLPKLARQFRAAGEHMAAERRQPLAPGHHTGPAQPRAADTSGLGASRLPEPAPAPAAKAWYLPSRWLD